MSADWIIAITAIATTLITSVTTIAVALINANRDTAPRHRRHDDPEPDDEGGDD